MNLLATTMAALASVDPELAAETVEVVWFRVATKNRYRRAIARALAVRPDLLTSGRPEGPLVLDRFILELLDAGAVGLVTPRCASCGVSNLPPHRFGIGRVCGSCRARRAQAGACSRCGRQSNHLRGRTRRDGPVCERCYRNEPSRLMSCSRCEQVKGVAKHGPAGPLCYACADQLATALCGICGQHRPCLNIRTGMPRCEPCARREHPCNRCGRTRRVRARTKDGWLCGTCFEQNPVFDKVCTGCGALGHIYHHGLCDHCACDRWLRRLLTATDPLLQPDLDRLRSALVDSRPHAVLHWLITSKTATGILTKIATGGCPLTHEGLDEHLSPKAALHLRGVLVAAGILPARDDHLARLEHWLAAKLNEVLSVEHRRLLRTFTTWHHLARLRRKLRGQPATANQVSGIKESVRHTVAFLQWLDNHGLTLETLRQSDVDAWLADGTSTRHSARPFLLWAVQSGHAAEVEIPAYQKAGQTQPLDAQRRWALARQLLADTTIATLDRVAGLFLLLYAQPLSTIAKLTTNHVTYDNADTYVLFGETPLLLPEPAAALVAEHIDSRSAYYVVGRNHDTPWLFPGVHRGRHISPGHLGNRLRKLGICSRPGRTAALLDLTTQLPAAALARLLGISHRGAARWVDRSGNSWANYGAELQRRAAGQESGTQQQV